MIEDKQMKIACEYYELVSQKVLSNAEEIRLLEILEYALEDADVCSLLSEIDERLLLDTANSNAEQIEPIVVDAEKIIGFISSYDPEKDDLPLASKVSSSDILIGYIQNVVMSNSPSETLRTFQELFIQESESYSVTKVSQALKVLITMEDSARTFSQVLYECIYIPINQWFTKPDAHIFIIKLIDIFDQREILKVSGTISQSLFSSLVAFSQSEYFIKLFRLSNCIRNQIFYHSTSTSTGSVSTFTGTLANESTLCKGSDNDPPSLLRAPQVSQDAPTVMKPITSFKPTSDQVLPVQADTVPEQTVDGFERHKQQVVSQLIRVIKGIVSSLQPEEQWHSYRQPTRRSCKVEKLCKLPTVDQIALVESPIYSDVVGRIRLNGTYWKAKLDSSYASHYLLPGQQVILIAREQLTLIVRPYKAKAKMPNVQKVADVGVVENLICSGAPGRVSFNGNSWKAELHDGFQFNTLYPGETVKVAFLRGNSLVVAPLSLPAKTQVQAISNPVRAISK